MGSIDLKDAYYSVLVREQDRRFLRFLWRDQHFQFRVLSNGLACAPRVFTKLLKPAFSTLREKGCECFPYIDDTFVIADSAFECSQALGELRIQLETLGFVKHEKKPVLVPDQEFSWGSS